MKTTNTKQHSIPMMAATLAITIAITILTTAAKAESSLTPYIGVTAEMRSDADPRDHEGVRREFNEQRGDYGTAGVYAGIRYGRIGFEGGWMLKKTVRWTKIVRKRNNVEIKHEAEVERGGSYVAATFDVISGASASVYIKGGLARGNQWITRLNGETTGTGDLGTVVTSGGGVRYEMTDNSLEVRVEVEMRHDPDLGTKVGARVSAGWRF